MCLLSIAANEDDGTEWHMVQVTSGDACWLVQRSYENFKMLDAQLHQCIYDRKISQLPDLSSQTFVDVDVEVRLVSVLLIAPYSCRMSSFCFS